MFCARIGDHPSPVYRFVESEAADAIFDDTLACLHLARPPDGFDTPRALSEDTIEAAFDAWKIARADIVQKWNAMADPANLQSPVAPRPARAAARDHSRRRLLRHLARAHLRRCTAAQLRCR
ncbi:MAG: hypothetical protein OXH86_18310 [Acidimicrobiaceae bacterium]|nr:hypothetical protein [Acidimicrobiaceae bacterium]MDE0499295.1 hypothetical protein [Acidimicrobiaceae bacterium]